MLALSLALVETEVVGRRIEATITKSADSRIPIATLPPLTLAQLSWAQAAQI